MTLNPPPVAGIKAAELSISIARLVTPPTSMESGVNSLVKVGAGAGVTVRVALAEPELPKADVRSPVVLTRLPLSWARTSKVTVHDDAPDTVPPV